MANALELAIESLSDPGVALPDALRRLLVVSQRVRADDLTVWLRSELSGYPSGDTIPIYRAGGGMPIKLRFDDMFGGSASMSVSGAELPADLGSVLDVTDIKEPVAELQALGSGNVDAELALPTAWVVLYRQAVTEGKVPSYDRMVLNHASIVMPRTYLRGLLDTVKTSALELALGVEDISPDAGQAGGPTVTTDSALANAVKLHVANLYAPGAVINLANNAAIAVGDGAAAVQILPGDVEGVLAAAGAFLGSAGVGELRDAIRRDGGAPAEETKSFLERVRSGGAVLATGMATNGAYEGLMALLGQAFPGVVG